MGRLPGKGNHKGKGPEVRTCLVCSNNCKEVGVPGARRARGEREGEEATGGDLDLVVRVMGSPHRVRQGQERNMSRPLLLSNTLSQGSYLTSAPCLFLLAAALFRLPL